LWFDQIPLKALATQTNQTPTVICRQLITTHFRSLRKVTTVSQTQKSPVHHFLAENVMLWWEKKRPAFLRPVRRQVVFQMCSLDLTLMGNTHPATLTVEAWSPVILVRFVFVFLPAEMAKTGQSYSYFF